MVQTYLLALLAGVSPDPAALVKASCSFQGMDEKQLAMVQTSLLCQINGGSL